jgi:Flp pilus assembly pilin Flp
MKKSHRANPEPSVLERFLRDEDAPTAMEYAIVVSGIAVVVVAAVLLFGQKVLGTFNAVTSHVP